MTGAEAILLPALKATLLIGPASLYARRSRGASAATRHLACFAALVAAAALPALAAVLPAVRVAVLPVDVSGARPGPPGLSGVWAIGFALVLFARLRSEIGLCRLMASGRAATDLRILRAADAAAGELGAARPVRLVVVPGARVPFVAGLVRPFVALPAEARGWSDSRLRAVFLHELGHVRRRDPLTQAIAGLAVAILWFHPLAWLAARRMREEREAACDDLVLARGGRPSRYAAMLLGAAARLRDAPRSAAALGPAQPLGRRLRALLGAERRRGSPGRAGVAGLVAATLLAAACLAPLAPARAGAPGSGSGPARHPHVFVSVSAGVSVSGSARAR